MLDEISVFQTRPIALICNATDNWKECTWQKIDGEHCIFRYNYNPERVGSQWENTEVTCDSLFKNPKFIGSNGYEYGKKNHLCQIEIESAEFDHEGEYECRLQKCQEAKDGGCQSNAKELPLTAKVSVKVFTLETNTK